MTRKSDKSLDEIGESKPSLMSRLAWLVLIWGASIAALALAAAILRFLMALAGLTA